jgi:hypothetical protein
MFGVIESWDHADESILPNRIRIIVKGGKVTLEGVVDNEGDKNIANIGIVPDSNEDKDGLNGLNVLRKDVAAYQGAKRAG